MWGRSLSKRGYAKSSMHRTFELRSFDGLHPIFGQGTEQHSKQTQQLNGPFPGVVEGVYSEGRSDGQDR